MVASARSGYEPAGRCARLPAQRRPAALPVERGGDVSAKRLEVGDVVQIDPAHDAMFGGSFMVVTEVKSWGAQGYVKALKEGTFLAYYRCNNEAMEYIGRAIWVSASDGEEVAV